MLFRSVGASTLPWAHTAASRRFATASNLHFGDPNEADVYTYDEMEPVLEALKKVHGDLSHGEKRFQNALAQLRFRAPNGTTTLDERHQAIAPIYLARVEKDVHGKLFVHQFRVVRNVEQTFGGYFSPTTLPPSRRLPACKRRKPPPWASSTPTTR